MVLLTIPLTLIALVGALMLLAKAQKESLHDIFKYASYFVITLCIFTLSLALVHAFDHRKEKKMVKVMNHMGGGSMGCHGESCSGMDCGGMECEGMECEGHGCENMGDMQIMMHKNMGGSGNCEMKDGDCCGKDGMKMEHKVIIKDTIIKK